VKDIQTSNSYKQSDIRDGRVVPLMEEFYTIQGEGFHTGKAAYFVRIGGCDVGCHWCDVKESWNADLHPPTIADKIVENAKTTFKVIDKNSNSTLVEMKPITGRKHQLRKQLFEIGHSIYGDQKYRSINSEKGLNKNLMLHSYQIKFMINDKKYTYTALLPDYFKKLLTTKRLSFSN